MARHAAEAGRVTPWLLPPPFYPTSVHSTAWDKLSHEAVGKRSLNVVPCDTAPSTSREENGSESTPAKDQHGKLQACSNTPSSAQMHICKTGVVLMK